MQRRTFEDTLRLDEFLQQLALYEVCKGLLFVPDDIEKLSKIQKKVVYQFNYFKTLIRNESISFDELKSYILGKYGPYPQPKEQTLDDVLKRILEGKRNDIKQLDEGKLSNHLIDNFLRESGFKDDQKS